MVFSVVLKTYVPPELSVEQYKEKLDKRLELLKPDRVSTFQVQTVVYVPNINTGQPSSSVTINQFLHSEYPATCFSVIEQQSEPRVLTGDIGLASLQRRLCDAGVCSERKPSNMECIGKSSKLGDFQVKIGAVTHMSSNRGVIVEVSYSCANTSAEAYGIISEFISSTFGW